MQRWQIPAKTFLLGEYVALLNGPALLLTTTPCFHLSLNQKKEPSKIHDESPAGLLWKKHGHPEFNLKWEDPFHGLGGLGASSAQFIGTYLAIKTLNQQPIDQNELLDWYFNLHWQGIGLKPSGYDILAQINHHCVYVNQHNDNLASFSWPFTDLAFILLHSGEKLATHHHLKSMKIPDGTQQLSPIVEDGKTAFLTHDATLLISAVNQYQDALEKMQLTTRNSLQQINFLKQQPEVLAAKGCGAMGSDVILLLVPKNALISQVHHCKKEGLIVLATSNELYSDPSLFAKYKKNT